MLKLFVGEIELIPVDIGAQKVQIGSEDVLIITFQSDKQLDKIYYLFRNLSDDVIVKITNENHEKTYTGYTSLGDEISVKMNVDGTYNYTVYLHKKSALDIAKQAAADAEYLAVVSGVDL